MAHKPPLPEMVKDTEDLLAVKANGTAFCKWLEYSDPSESTIGHMTIVKIPEDDLEDALSANIVFDEEVVEGKFLSAISVESYIVDHLGFRDKKISLMINDKFRDYIRSYMGETICGNLKKHPFVEAVLGTEGKFMLNITWKK